MKQTVLGYSEPRKFMNIYTVPFIDLSPSGAVGSPFVSDDWEKA